MEHNKQDSPPKCKQCGACCLILENGNYRDCKWLIRYIPGGSCTPKTRCAIYKWRLQSITGPHQYCGKRERMSYNFPGCPYNKKEWTTHAKYKKDISVSEVHETAKDDGKATKIFCPPSPNT